MKVDESELLPWWETKRCPWRSRRASSEAAERHDPSSRGGTMRKPGAGGAPGRLGDGAAFPLEAEATPACAASFPDGCKSARAIRWGQYALPGGRRFEVSSRHGLPVYGVSGERPSRLGARGAFFGWAARGIRGRPSRGRAPSGGSPKETGSGRWAFRT